MHLFQSTSNEFFGGLFFFFLGAFFSGLVNREISYSPGFKPRLPTDTSERPGGRLRGAAAAQPSVAVAVNYCGAQRRGLPRAECSPQERMEPLALALTTAKPPRLNLLFLGFLWAIDRITMFLKWVSAVPCSGTGRSGTMGPNFLFHRKLVEKGLDNSCRTETATRNRCSCSPENLLGGGVTLQRFVPAPYLSSELKLQPCRLSVEGLPR